MQPLARTLPAIWVHRTYVPSLLLLVSLTSLFACSEGIGAEGSTFPQPLTALSGGVIYSTSVLDGANGYDLYWSPLLGTTPVTEQGFIQLTTTTTDDYHPSISASGEALAFARRDEGIFFVNAEGQVSRVSDTRGTSFFDSLPAVNMEGDRVAWVREDTSRPIGQGNFIVSTSEIWIANADGSNARAVNPRPDVVQFAPVFEPVPRSTRLAWTEFNATTFGQPNRRDYGVWLHDLSAFTGRFACQGDYQLPDSENIVRCLGLHLAWPEANRLVLSQQLLEIDPTNGPVRTQLPELLSALASSTFVPQRTNSSSGFFPPFPLSVSYGHGNLIVDGVIAPLDGDLPTLAFIVAGTNAESPFRYRITGHRSDIDSLNTSGYLFSLATPQIVP